jgi:hypothetical protein
MISMCISAFVIYCLLILVWMTFYFLHIGGFYNIIAIPCLEMIKEWQMSEGALAPLNVILLQIQFHNHCCTSIFHVLPALVGETWTILEKLVYPWNRNSWSPSSKKTEFDMSKLSSVKKIRSFDFASGPNSCKLNLWKKNREMNKIVLQWKIICSDQLLPLVVWTHGKSTSSCLWSHLQDC